MEIIATAHLRYWDGESIASGWERLDAVVRFKEYGKFFKTELAETLVSTFQVDNMHLSSNPLTSYTEYFGECEKYLNDTYLTKKVAEEMIIDYFNKKLKNDLKDSRSKDIQNKVHKLGKIEIKVKIN